MKWLGSFSSLRWYISCATPSRLEVLAEDQQDGILSSSQIGLGHGLLIPHQKELLLMVLHPSKVWDYGDVLEIQGLGHSNGLGCCVNYDTS